MQIDLVIVDPQDSFCRPGGELYVDGADRDMERLAAFIKRAAPVLDDIHVSLDSHQELHIAHPPFVVDGKGSHPDPYTQIDYDMGKAGKYRAANPDTQDYWLEGYLKPLQENGRYPYIIWPPHCRIGTVGQTVVPVIGEALRHWALKEFATVDWVPKGSAWRTEHYSIVQADVPDPDDPTTQLNHRFLEPLERADMLIIAGEAGSHCVANTYRDVAEEFGGSYDFSKWVLLEDCQSPVPLCEKLQTDAMAEMAAKGMRIMTSVELLRELDC